MCARSSLKMGIGGLFEREMMRRRLASTPNYVDIVVIIALSCLMFYLLKLLLKISLQWKMATRLRIQEILEQRRNARDEFRTENGYSWDYCVVFKVLGPKEEATEQHKQWNLKYIVRELTKGGLETKLFYSSQADEVYLKIRVAYDRLQREADRINLKLPLDPIQLRHLLHTGRSDGERLLWGPVFIPEKSPETSLSPYDYIYARYEYQREDVMFLYKQWKNRTVFRSVDRLKLILSIIKSSHAEGGSGLDLEKILTEGGILGCFPIHDKLEILSLQEEWLVFWQWPWNQPIDNVKNYFGEKIGLYFLWLAHYTSWMLFAGIIGFFCWINIADKGNDPNAVIVPYFSCFMAIWATLFLEFWKRKEAFHGMKWGMSGFEDEEQTRPQFQGIPIQSPINGQEYLYFSSTEKTKRLIYSAIIINGFIALVIAIVGSIFVLKLVLSANPSTSSSAGIIASIANAIQIQIMNIIYGGVAVKLTDYENHRTDTEYEDSLIAKTFVFQFVNSFAALFYITFFKPYLTVDPCLGTCLGELQTNLGTIFLTRLALGNTLKVIIPNILTYLAEQSNQSGKLIHAFTELEREFFLAEYHVMLGPFTDYADAAIQYGFATMFIVAYPLATILSFVNNYIQLRVDAWRLLQQCRRPEPRSAEDIGTWQSIFETVSIFALIINAALIAFTGLFAINHTWAERIWIFVCTASGLYGIKLFVAAVIPDVPPEVDIQLKRQEYILGKVLDNIQDENDENLLDVETIRVPDYSVKFTDEDQL